MLFYEIITIYAAKVGFTYSSYWELKGYYHVQSCLLGYTAFTRQYIPEDNPEHHTRRRENLKSHTVIIIIFMPGSLSDFNFRVLKEQCSFSENILPSHTNSKSFE
jgi:hypothetical protein